MNNLKIGWAGLGNMGSAMAANLLRAGYEVRVYNRNKDKEKELTSAGAQSAKDLRELVDSCDVVFTMLSDDHAVKEVYNETNGLLSGENSGKLLIDMSTVAPETSRYLSALSEKHKMKFIEAPVSGSVKPAQDGTLIILVGGSAENYNKAKPLFDVLGKLSLYLGGAGAGSSAKLAINYLLGINIQALAETVLFAEQNGISKENMLTIINEGACGNGIIKIKTPSVLNNNYPAAFALKYIVKDLKLAKEAGLSSPLSIPLLNTFSAAMNEGGLGDQDLMSVIKYLEKT
ncbi:NAD(P)-dependent oxidoreductase [Pedobacter panaciterrae]|jgi:3-hydroxyisobutyrate dehydrogenase and related beta-hydroxyacid dehydrogenases|uniref:NAD(P)-dependent oxidoreductase n=1 Tax=Pedobacter panaciterrae TaxID=363849 RepID=A0ABU8NTD9_9SPHI|nr:NAD(P)-dependent oxidoreductase [Pedobacter panaciterrae]NQX53410.1 NAD(P)-dependent oxidoreductase [Pedobacter panaciterrae]